MLFDSALDQVREGLTSLETALSVTVAGKDKPADRPVEGGAEPRADIPVGQLRPRRHGCSCDFPPGV